MSSPSHPAAFATALQPAGAPFSIGKWMRPRAAVSLAVLMAGAAAFAPPLALAQAPAAAQPGGSPAAAGDDLKQTFTDAMAAFQAGNYQTTITNLESVLSKAGPGADLEAIYFTLGAAYFNTEQYPQAVETLKKYIAKYPKGSRVAEAQFSIGQAYLFAKDYTSAATAFQQLENVPQYHDQALLYEGTAYNEAKQPDEAIAALEKLVSGGIKDATTANGAILLANLYAQKAQGEKAMAILEQIRQNVALVDNIVRLNSVAVELGDDFLQKKMPAEALACYRIVRSRDEVIKFQTARLAATEKKLNEGLALMRSEAVRTDATKVTQQNARNNQLRAEIAEQKKLLEEFQKLPDFGPALLLRIGRCFYDMDKKWESIVVYDDFLKKYPEGEDRERALFALIVSSAEVNRIGKTRELCEQYLKEYKDNPNASTVAYLLGATALQANDPAAAETYFGRMVEDPNTAANFKEEVRFLLGNAKFAQTKYDDAAKDYEKYLKDFPNGSHTEEVTYRIALCSLFAGNYEVAMKQLEDFIKAHPKGDFTADAKYRYDVCKYAASLYQEVADDCKAWEKEYGSGHAMIGEVLALEADALSALGKDDEAIATYIRSYKAATSDEVLNYSLFAAQKLLQKKGAWDKIGAMFEEFVKTKPDDPTVVAAMYWIGKAKAHEGKVDEAKQFIADTIKTYIDDPKRDAVEQLLSQLAQLCVRKKRPQATAVASASPAASPEAGASPAVAAASPAGAEPGASPAAAEAASSPAVAEAAASPAETPADPGAELDRLLGGAEADRSPTARARILYAKAELARMRKQIPEEEKNLQAIADNIKPEALSATLLAQVGDYLLGKQQWDKAAALFQRLMDDYPKSDVLDYAYNGLGEVAYQKKDYQRALRLFTDAVDKVGAQQKLKDVTVGRAKTLLAMDRLDEAKKMFEQIASVREWRGEATAFAVYSLGEIAQKQDKLPEAIAYYQRVFVAYQRYLPWVAKAYLKSAECFEKLGKTQEAINTYQEMLKNEKLASFSETEVARKRLQELGQVGQR